MPFLYKNKMLAAFLKGSPVQLAASVSSLFLPFRLSRLFVFRFEILTSLIKHQGICYELNVSEDKSNLAYFYFTQ